MSDFIAFIALMLAAMAFGLTTLYLLNKFDRQ